MSHRKPQTQNDVASTLAAEIRAVFGKIKRRLRYDEVGNDLTLSQISVILRYDQMALRRFQASREPKACVRNR